MQPKVLAPHAFWLAAILTLALLTTTLEVVAHTRRPSPPWPSSPLLPVQSYNGSLRCGSSPAEAQRQGCLFDTLSFAWQVPACYDADTISEFQTAHDWKYWADEQGSKEVESTVLGLDEGPVHVSSRFHSTHCLYLRRQMVRLLASGAPLDTHLGAYKHTEHCEGVLLGWGPMGKGDLHTRAPVIYPECWPLAEWRRG